MYLDASAIARLVFAETGWEALLAYLGDHPDRVASAIAATEVRRAVLRRAGELMPATLRTLDALHVATAIEVGPLAAMITYDRRQADAAVANGLEVVAPV